ncbi:calcium-binding protein [Ruegeria sp. ANG10]|uniref:calcium-binding protein n=1 Tax=Ruegeria sp. ANG10 TaxID=3042467 RepID=UPI00345560E2
MTCHTEEPEGRKNFGNNPLPDELNLPEKPDYSTWTDSQLNDLVTAHENEEVDFKALAIGVQATGAIPGWAIPATGLAAVFGLIDIGLTIDKNDVSQEIRSRDPNSNNINKNGNHHDDVSTTPPHVGPAPEPPQNPTHDVPINGSFHCPPTSPLVIDLDGDGIELTALYDTQTFFDLNIDGFAELTGWVQPDDGLLALDVNGNGAIDDNSELFGNATGFDNGFLQLAELDSNGDGVIDANDDQFSELNVWRDLDQDGVSDDGELQSLAETGIVSIDLNSEEVNETNQDHLVSDRSTVEFSDGTSGIIEDIHFQNDPSISVTLWPDGFEYSDDALVMPLLFGYGQISSTWISFSLDENLLSQATDLLEHLANGEVGLFKEAFETFLLDWAGVSDVDPTSRGDHIDARHLVFLEKVYGTGFVGATLSTDPGLAAGEELGDFYDALVTKLAGRFAAQSAASSAIISSSNLSELTENFEAHPLASLTPLALNYSTDVPYLYGDMTEVFSGFQEKIDNGTLTSGNAAAAVFLLKGDLSSSDEEFGQLVQSAISDAGIDQTSDFALALIFAGDLQIVEGTAGNDTLTATEASYIIGGLGDDVITASSDGNSIVGGKGDDTITGGQEGDTYYYSSGDGSDVILDDSGFASAIDLLKFTDVNVDDVTFSHNSGGDLVITLSDGETITVTDHFSGTRFHIEQIEFADGTVLDLQEIRDKTVSDAKASGFVKGSTLAETFVHNLGDGSYTISDVSGFSNVIDKLVFADVNVADVTLTIAPGDDLVFTLSNGETVTISDYFRGSNYDMELIEFADGTSFDPQELRDKILSDMKAGGFVTGTSLADNYVHTLGDGSYTISDGTGASFVNDKLTFTDVNADDVTFSQNAGQDLAISLNNGETVTIADHFLSSNYDMELIQFADGTELNAQAIRDKTVSDMKASGFVVGSSKVDNYVHTLGDGSYTISDGTGASFVKDKLTFTDVNADDVTFSQNAGQDLVIALSNGETITVADHFLNPNHDLELIEFADGTTLGLQEIRDKSLLGGSGDDTIIGFSSDDVIDGGAGDDILTGGAGTDVFVFNTLASEGADSINDFELGTDTLELAGTTYADLIFVDTGSGTRVEWNNGSVELEGITLASLTEDQFSFI